MTKNIDYLSIFKDSARLVWNKKIVAVFGFFITLGSLGNGFNYATNEDEKPADGGNFMGVISESKETFSNFISGHEGVLAILLVVVLIIGIVFIVLRALGIASLTKFAGGTMIEKDLGFKDLFSKGKEYVLRIVSIEIVSGLLVLVLLLIFSVPTIFLFMEKSYALGSLVALMALVIFLPVLVLIHFIKKFSYVFLVVSDIGVRDSIEKAYAIFRKNILSSFIFSLLVALISYILFFAVFLPFMIVLPFLGIDLLLALATSPLALAETGVFGIIIATVAILLAVVIFIIVSSFFEAFNQIAWTRFVMEIDGIKKTEEAQEAQESAIILPEAKTEKA